MKLWIRKKKLEHLQADLVCDVRSQEEWQALILEHRPVSSILWAEGDLFKLSGKHYNRRMHYHEIDYVNDVARNISYRNAAERIAQRIRTVIGADNAIVYAPLRGALPIWRAVKQFLGDIESQLETYYPVTSSFVFYPESFGEDFFTKKGRPGNGHLANVLELERIRGELKRYKYFIYIDEICSGGMMRHHLKSFRKQGLQDILKVVAVGMADDSKHLKKRQKHILGLIGESVSKGVLHDFIVEWCDSLITEDQRYLIGAHYTDNNWGPNIVPLLDEDLDYFEEKKLFEKDVFTITHRF